MFRFCFIFLALTGLLLASCRNGEKSGEAGSGKGDTINAGIAEMSLAIGDGSSDASLYNRRARYYFLDQQFNKALQDVNKAITLDGKQSAYYVTLSDIYLLMGDPQKSRDALLRAAEINPRDTDALLKLAKLYLIIKEYKLCYQTIKQLLEVDNTIAAAFYTRSVALLEQGDTLRAVDDLKQAIDRNQEYYEAYISLGELYAMKKDPLAALYLKNALNIKPTSKEALYMLGMFQQETGQYEQAISTYQVLARTDSTFRDAPYNIGYIYLVYLKDFPKAASFFSLALERDPLYAEAWFNRGYAYELAGEYKKAYSDYKQSLKVHVNYEKAIEGLNRLDRLMGGGK
jgi:tetratricopeptide (TPR) repeat protein